MKVNEIKKRLSFEKMNTSEYGNVDVKDLLLLFKKYGRYSLQHQKAQEMWQYLEYYLNNDELHNLFINWEELHLHNKVDNYYGYINDLIRKFS